MKTITKLIKSDIIGKYTHIKNNLNSWSGYYWLFFFFFVPIIILFIPQIPKILFDLFQINPQSPFDFLNSSFILNPQSPQVSSVFLMHYTHLELVHLCQNLFFYLIFVTIIFVIEIDKKRLIYCSFLFFLLLPFILSEISILFLTSFPNNIHSAKGFSGIVFAFAGYTIYLLIIPYVSQIIQGLKNAYEIKDFSRFFPLVSVWIFMNLILVIAIMFTGFSLGQFLGEGNGIAHFVGYISGWIAPLVLDIKKQREKIVEQVVVIIQILGAISLYIVYLTRIHPGI